MRLLGCLFLGVVAVALQAARAAPRATASAASAASAASPRQQDDGLVGLVEAEVLAWRAAGYASVMQFPDDARRPSKAFLAGNPAGTGNRPNAIVPTEDDVKFHVFTRSNESDIEGTCVSLDEQSLRQAGWDPGLPTKVIVHGFTNTIASRAIQDIKNAYLGRGRYNVVGVDWGALCPAPLYVTARLNVGFAASRVAALLRLLLAARLAEPSALHLLGHSLGAHVAGLAAQELHNSTGERPGRITGLDPAWPLFMLAPPTARLSAQQADTVDVIHTCAGYLGFPTAIGTTDFFPNGGSSQPGCVADALGICAHDRSFQYFVESITQGAGYQADYCTDDKAARHAQCADKPDGCMGDEIYFRKEGSYYVNTTVEDAAKECRSFNPST